GVGIRVALDAVHLAHDPRVRLHARLDGPLGAAQRISGSLVGVAAREQERELAIPLLDPRVHLTTVQPRASYSCTCGSSGSMRYCQGPSLTSTRPSCSSAASSTGSELAPRVW